MKGIAFFDFDGTITKSDTLFEFIKFTKGQLAFYWGLILHSPLLVAMKLKFVSNQYAKERVLAHFFKGTPLDDFNTTCAAFSDRIIPQLIREGALAEIGQLKERGFTIVVVSASPENWIAPWCKQHQLELIASCLETENGKLTGKLNGKNCHGAEKVSRIQSVYKIADYEIVHAYGDTSGDLPMLELAGVKHYKPFR